MRCVVVGSFFQPISFHFTFALVSMWNFINVHEEQISIECLPWQILDPWTWPCSRVSSTSSQNSPTLESCLIRRCFPSDLPYWRSRRKGNNVAPWGQQYQRQPSPSGNLLDGKNFEFYFEKNRWLLPILTVTPGIFKSMIAWSIFSDRSAAFWTCRGFSSGAPETAM